MTENPLFQQNNAYLLFASQVHLLDKPQFLIGRHLDNDLILESGFVSRFHVGVTQKGGQYYLKDLNSTSGTYLNETKISEGLLASGDTIHIANIAILFVEETGNDISEKLSSETGSLKKIRTPSKVTDS